MANGAAATGGGHADDSGGGGGGGHAGEALAGCANAVRSAVSEFTVQVRAFQAWRKRAVTRRRHTVVLQRTISWRAERRLLQAFFVWSAVAWESRTAAVLLSRSTALCAVLLALPFRPRSSARRAGADGSQSRARRPQLMPALGLAQQASLGSAEIEVLRLQAELLQLRTSLRGREGELAVAGTRGGALDGIVASLVADVQRLNSALADQFSLVATSEAARLTAVHEVARLQRLLADGESMLGDSCALLERLQEGERALLMRNAQLHANAEALEHSLTESLQEQETLHGILAAELARCDGARQTAEQACAALQAELDTARARTYTVLVEAAEEHDRLSASLHTAQAHAAAARVVDLELAAGLATPAEQLPGPASCRVCSASAQENAALRLSALQLQLHISSAPDELPDAPLGLAARRAEVATLTAQPGRAHGVVALQSAHNLPAARSPSLEDLLTLLRSELDEARINADSSMAALQTVAADCEAAVTHSAVLEEEMNFLTVERDEARTRAAALQCNESALEQQLADAQAELAVAVEARDQALSRASALRATSGTVAAQMTVLQAKLDACTAELQTVMGERDRVALQAMPPGTAALPAAPSAMQEESLPSEELTAAVVLSSEILSRFGGASSLSTALWAKSVKGSVITWCKSSATLSRAGVLELDSPAATIHLAACAGVTLAAVDSYQLSSLRRGRTICFQIHACDGAVLLAATASTDAETREWAETLRRFLCCVD